MSHSVNNPHDKFVRETFSDPERARAFVEEFLPEELVNQLDLPTLVVLQESFITNELGEYFSDLVLEIKLKEFKQINKKKVNVCLLFEHKSAPDKNVLIQVGYYIFARLFKQVREQKELNLVIPVIYYQGTKKWKAPSLVELFTAYPKVLKKFIPVVEHIFIALNEIPDHQISSLRHAVLAASLSAQKLRENPEDVIENIKKVFSLFPPEKVDWNFFEMIVVYTLSVAEGSEDVLTETIKSIPPPIKDNIMTLYDLLIEKGEIQGEIKGKAQMILALYDDGISIPQLAKAAKITEEEVLKILKENGRVK